MTLRARLQGALPPGAGVVLAYILALLGAPLAVAALGFWALMIPVFAIWFGGVPYLLLAGPGFALALRHIPPNPVWFAAIGAALNLASPAWFAAWLAWRGMAFDWAAIAPLWQFGFGMAAVWGAAFALLYRLFRWLLVSS